MRLTPVRRARVRCSALQILMLALACCLGAASTAAAVGSQQQQQRVSIKINRPAEPRPGAAAANSYHATSFRQSSSSSSSNNRGTLRNPNEDPTYAVSPFSSSWSVRSAWPDLPPSSYVPRAAAAFALPPDPPLRENPECEIAGLDCGSKGRENLNVSSAGADSMQLPSQFLRPLPVDAASWRSLSHQCADHVINKYTYRVCPFHNVTQSLGAAESGAAPSFVLGLWHSWHYERRTEELSMQYTDGVPCGNGQRRQTKLILRCIQRMPAVAADAAAAAASDSVSSSPAQSPLLPPSSFFLRHMLEGSRCSYTARLYTPLVCGRGYRTSKKLKRFRRRREQQRIKAAAALRPRGRMLALDPSASLREVVASHSSSSSTLQSRIAFHAAVSERERCIQRLIALMQTKRKEAAAARHSTDEAEETDVESVTPSAARRRRSAAPAASSSSLSLLRSKQQLASVDSACARFRPPPSP